MQEVRAAQSPSVKASAATQNSQTEIKLSKCVTKEKASEWEEKGEEEVGGRWGGWSSGSWHLEKESRGTQRIHSGSE